MQTGQAAATTTATRFYPLPAGISALRDAAGLSYVASDHLGTPLATLNLDTGAVLGEQLRAPYGQARYAASAATNGGMRTTYGFTGQREDASAAGSSGLDYFNARYYDPAVGRFTSPDSLTGSDPLLDGYTYVGGHVESTTDPSGHRPTTCDSDECGGGDTRGGDGGGPDMGGGTGGGGGGGGDGDGGGGGDDPTGGGSGDNGVSASAISEIGAVVDDPVPETTGRFDPDGQAWERAVAEEEDAAPETTGRFTGDAQGRPTQSTEQSDQTDSSSQSGKTGQNPTNPKPPDTQTSDGGGDTTGGDGDGGSPPGGSGPGAPPPPLPATSTELADGAQQAADALPSVYDGAQVDVPADTYNWEFQPERTVMDDSYNPAFGSYTMRYYLQYDDGFGSRVKVSANFDPYLREWDPNGWKLSHGQLSEFWKYIRDELDREGWP